ERPFADRILRRPQMALEMVQIAQMTPAGGSRETQLDRLSSNLGFKGSLLARLTEFKWGERAKPGAATPARHDVIEVLSKRSHMLLSDLSGVRHAVFLQNAAEDPDENAHIGCRVVFPLVPVVGDQLVDFLIELGDGQVFPRPAAGSGRCPHWSGRFKRYGVVRLRRRRWGRWCDRRLGV